MDDADVCPCFVHNMPLPDLNSLQGVELPDWCLKLCQTRLVAAVEAADRRVKMEVAIELVHLAAGIAR